MSKAAVERLYKGLFVYSTGFNELIQNITKRSKNNFIVMCSIWKVYSILLEFCCKNDYSMLISQVTERYIQNEEKLKVEFSKKLREKDNVLSQVQLLNYFNSR